MKNIVLFYVAILLSIGLGCKGCYTYNPKDAYLDSLVKKYCTQRIELRDSLYIIYIVKQWRNKGFIFGAIYLKCSKCQIIQTPKPALK